MGTLNVPQIGQPNSTEDVDIKTAIETFNNLLDGSNKIPGTSLATAAEITRAQLKAEARGVQGAWYAAKEVATEETRSNTAFGTLTTADEIKEVVVPAGGLLVINYSAIFKSSVSAAGRAAIFIGANQLKRPEQGGAPVVQEVSTSGTSFGGISNTREGLGVGGSGTSFVATGESSASGNFGGDCIVRRLAAGTYAVSVQYKATSGSVTAKERLLQVRVFGS